MESLKKECEKESGTYLFYGNDNNLVYKSCLDFIKMLCNDKSISKRIDNGSYSDITILENKYGVDDIRELINLASQSAFEDNKKFFILKDIGKLRREPANALLKLIEEPPKNSYFILLNKDLNILPTIKSRSMLVKIKNATPQDLGVDRDTYDFFVGKANDILSYKESELSLDRDLSYKNLSEILENYDGEIESKIALYTVLRDFARNSDNISDIEKIFFAETIATCQKDEIMEIINYIVHTLKDKTGLNKRLTRKSMLNVSINMKMFLIDFCLNI